MHNPFCIDDSGYSYYGVGVAMGVQRGSGVNVGIGVVVGNSG
jgi:hypothetical protein